MWSTWSKLDHFYDSLDFYVFREKKIHSSTALQLLQTQKYLLETIYTASVKAGQSWAIPYRDKSWPLQRHQHWPLEQLTQLTGTQPSPAEPVTYAGAALPAFWVSHTTWAVTLASKFRSVPQLLGLSRRWLRWLSLRRRPSTLQLLCSKRGEGEGSLRWHTGQHRLLAYKGNTSPLFASSWEFKNCISPPENCWSRGQAGFPNLRTGVVQQLPLATQPMNQEDLSNAAVPRPPPVWLVTRITGTEQNWTHPPAPTQWPIPNFNPRVLVRWNPLELQNLSKRHGWAGALAVSVKALRNGKLLTSSEPAVPSPCWAAWHLCLGHCPPPLGAPKPPLVAPSTAAGSCAGELWNRCSSAAVRLLPPHTSFLSLPSKIT